MPLSSPGPAVAGFVGADAIDELLALKVQSRMLCSSRLVGWE